MTKKASQNTNTKVKKHSDWTQKLFDEMSPEQTGELIEMTDEPYSTLGEVVKHFGLKPTQAKDLIAYLKAKYHPIATELRKVKTGSPVRQLTPGKVAQFIGPVMEAFFINLFMQPGSVEAHSKGKFHIFFQSLVTACGQHPVRIISLVRPGT